MYTTLADIRSSILPNIGTYSHRYFVRGNRKLCHLITRTTKHDNTQKSKASRDSDRKKSTPEGAGKKRARARDGGDPVPSKVASSKARSIASSRTLSPNIYDVTPGSSEVEYSRLKQSTGRADCFPYIDANHDVFAVGESDFPFATHIADNPLETKEPQAIAGQQPTKPTKGTWLKDHDKHLSEYASQLVGSATKKAPPGQSDDSPTNTDDDSGVIAEEIISTFTATDETL
jgi:hypothetical protein